MPLIFDTIERFARDRPDVNGYRGAAIGGHELYPLIAAGMECLVVPRHLGWSDIGTWKRLERVLADQQVSLRSARPSSSTPTTSSSPAWTGGRSSRSARPG